MVGYKGLDDRGIQGRQALNAGDLAGGIRLYGGFFLAIRHALYLHLAGQAVRAERYIFLRQRQQRNTAQKQ